MPIKFTCPKGHPLTAPDEAAGRTAKCRECGAAVRIPQPAEVAAGSSPSAANGADAPPAPTAEDLIVFLCPNGHRLHGPRGLEGRAGQCPHCGVKFRIPRHDEPDDEEEGSQILVGEQPASGDLAVQGVPAIGPAAASDAPTFDFHFEPARDTPMDAVKIDLGTGSGTGRAPDQAANRHPLSELFARLWDERARGAFLELHLADGVIIVPERFARELSRQKYGVFAVKDPDGTHTLTVVAWDAVNRVTIRRVGKLPKKMFD